METAFDPGSRALPFVIHAEGSGEIEELLELLREDRARLDSLLLEHGALLFRGFGARNASDVSRIIAAADATTMPYAGGISPRVALGRNVYTSTELPRRLRIVLHNELSYLHEHPHHLWFACVQPAEEGGETTLADGRAILHDLDAAVKAPFLAHGVRYLCTFRGESRFHSVVDRVHKVTKSWMEAFETTDRDVVEAHCERAGARARWLEDGALVMETDRPAVRTHPVTGESAWFNSAHLFRFSARGLGWPRYLLSRVVFPDRERASQHARFGDGGEIDAATLEHLFDVLDMRTVPVKWQRGDVLWVDNLTCMHGRNPFRGERRVLAAMTR
jgi:alpha-ketoglutarate-dependent taurine dioxygenase